MTGILCARPRVISRAQRWTPVGCVGEESTVHDERGGSRWHAGSSAADETVSRERVESMVCHVEASPTRPGAGPRWVMLGVKVRSGSFGSRRRRAGNGAPSPRRGHSGVPARGRVHDGTHPRPRGCSSPRGARAGSRACPRPAAPWRRHGRPSADARGGGNGTHRSRRARILHHDGAIHQEARRGARPSGRRAPLHPHPPADRLAEWSPPSARFRAVGSSAPFFSLAEQVGLARQIRALRPDLVHFCMPQQPVLLGIPAGHHLSRHDPPQDPQCEEIARRLVAATGGRLGCVHDHRTCGAGQHRPEPLQRRGSPPLHRSARSSHRPDLRGGRRDRRGCGRGSVPFERFVLFVGNQVPYKNLARLHDAVEILRAEDSRIGLVVAGRVDDDGRRILELNPDLAANVHFTGYVSDGGLRWLYENAAVFAFRRSSRASGFRGWKRCVMAAPWRAAAPRPVSPSLRGGGGVLRSR